MDLNGFEGPSELSSDEFSTLLHDIIDDVTSKREKAEVDIDNFAYRLSNTLSVGGSVDQVDVKRLLCITMRLRLAEHFCEALLATSTAHGTFNTYHSPNAFTSSPLTFCSVLFIYFLNFNRLESRGCGVAVARRGHFHSS